MPKNDKRGNPSGSAKGNNRRKRGSESNVSNIAGAAAKVGGTIAGGALRWVKASPIGKALIAAEVAATAASAVDRIIEDWVNHPTWYKHITTNPAIGLNFMQDRAAPIDPHFRGPSPALATAFRTVPVLDIDTTGITATDTYPKTVRDSVLHRTWASLATNSGRNPSYTVNDLRGYLASTRNYLAALTSVTLAFSVLSQYSATNSAMPRLFAKAMRFNITDWVANAASIREYLRNRWLAFTETFPVFGDIISRTLWLYGSIFVDDRESNKPGFYMHTPCGIFVVGDDDAVVTPDTAYFSAGIPGAFYEGINWNLVRQDIDKLWNALSAHYGDHVIKTDVLRVYGYAKKQELIRYYSSIVNSANPPLLLVEDSYMLRQIQNSQCISRFAGSTYSVPIININTEDFSTQVMTQASIDAAVAEFGMMFTPHQYINTDEKDMKDPGVLMSQTMLLPEIVAQKKASSQYTSWIVSSAGTEVPARMDVVFNFHSDNGYELISWPVCNRTIIIDPSLYSGLEYYERLLLEMSLGELSQMEFHPRIEVLDLANLGAGNKLLPRYFWDFDTYAEISNSSLSNIHDIASGSLLLGKVNKDSANFNPTYG